MTDITNSKPPLQKPPGYKNPNAPLPAGKPRVKPPLPPAFRPKRRRKSCCCICCCFLTILLFSLLLLLAISGAVFYLWFRPELPVFHIQSLQTRHFNVAVKPDGTFLDSQTVVRIQATNPNGKVGFSYGRSQARVSVDGDVGLGEVSFPGFEQRRRNITVLKFATQVKGLLIDDGVGGKLKKGFAKKELGFHVEMGTEFGAKFGNWQMGKVKIRVLCDGILKKLSNGATPKCKINLLKWITLP